jgi:hypothetical protein
MGTIKTRPTGDDVTAFLDAVPAERRRAEGHAVRALMERVTGAPATMWGPSMVGFGSQPYTNTTGTNEWFVVGFSPRKAALTIYGVHDGYAEPDPLLDELGPHTTGKGCLYVKRLDDVDAGVLERLVRNAWERAGRTG